MNLLECAQTALVSKFDNLEDACKALSSASYDDKTLAFDLAITHNSMYTTPKHLPFSQQKLAEGASMFSKACRG